MQRAAALVLAAIAAGCLIVALGGLATDRFTGRGGLILRIAGVLCFVAAVALGSTAR